MVITDMESRTQILALTSAALTLSCVKVPDPPTPDKVVAVHPLADDAALVIGDDFVATVAANGSINELRPLIVSCWKHPWSSEVRCPIEEHSDTIVVVGAPLPAQAGAPPLVRVLAVDRSTLRSRWSQEFSLEANDALADPPISPAEGHCLVHDTRAEGRSEGVVLDLACETGALRWRRVFPDVSVIYRATNSPRAALIGQRSLTPRAGDQPIVAECAAHEARFVDLSDGSTLARVPADPWFHCLVDDRLITVSGDDLVAYDLSAPGGAGEVLIAGFGARILLPTPSRFDCHRQGRSLVLRVDFAYPGFMAMGILVLDPEGRLDQYHAPPGDRPLIYPEGADLPPFIVFPANRGLDASEPHALDLSSGDEIFAKPMNTGFYARKSYYASGSLLAGEFPPVGVGPNGVVRYDPDTLAPDGVGFAHDESLLGVTDGVIWVSHEGAWPPWHRVDRHALTPLDGAPADLHVLDADLDDGTFLERRDPQIEGNDILTGDPSWPPPGPDPRCDHPPNALERARLTTPDMTRRSGPRRPAAPFRPPR